MKTSGIEVVFKKDDFKVVAIAYVPECQRETYIGMCERADAAIKKGVEEYCIPEHLSDDSFYKLGKFAEHLLDGRSYPNLLTAWEVVSTERFYDEEAQA